jgi:hypothetical protein
MTGHCDSIDQLWVRDVIRNQESGSAYGRPPCKACTFSLHIFQQPEAIATLSDVLQW